MPSHALQHPEVRKRIAAAPQWPSYKGVSQLVGINGRCAIYIDPSLGVPGVQNATDLLGDADRVMKFNDATFGGAGGHVDVIVFALGDMTDGTGGADHMGCDFSTGAQVEVCASFGDSLRCSGLFEAELSECSMNNQLCGLSTGEALSRWCAMLVSNNALSDFASAPAWFQQGIRNWVDIVDPSDTNYDSIGCGMAFISWLMGHALSLPKIAQAMVAAGDNGTLATLYEKLTGISAMHAWTDFQAAIAALPRGVTSDDPFGAMGAPIPGPTPPPQPPQPAPQPSPVPPPVPRPGTSPGELAFLLLDSIGGDVALHSSTSIMKAHVQAILDGN